MALVNIIHVLNNSVSFLAESMNKSDKIGMAGWTNAIEVPVVSFQSIAGAVKQLKLIIGGNKMSYTPKLDKIWIQPKTKNTKKVSLL